MCEKEFLPAQIEIIRPFPQKLLGPGLRVGLTGGIGSGKTQVGRILAKLGAKVLEADRVAQEVLAPGTAGLSAVQDSFGAEVIAAGVLDRTKLAERVFADKQALLRLEGIVHPLVSAVAQDFLKNTVAGEVRLYDVPLLVEKSLTKGIDLVMVVDSPVDSRLERLVTNRGMDEAAAKSRMSAQATTEQRRALAHIWVNNCGDLASLETAISQLWHEILLPLATKTI